MLVKKQHSPNKVSMLFEWSEPKAGADKRQYLPRGRRSHFDNVN